MLSLLLESHADPNQHAGGQLKRTPLHFAVTPAASPPPPVSTFLPDPCLAACPISTV